MAEFLVIEFGYGGNLSHLPLNFRGGVL